VLLNALNVEIVVQPIVCPANKIRSTIMESVLINVRLELSPKTINVYLTVTIKTVSNVIQTVTNVLLVEE